MTTYNEADQEAVEFVARKIRAQAKETTGAMAEMSGRIAALEQLLDEAFRRISALEEQADSGEPRSLSQIIEEQTNARRFLAR